MANLNRLLIGFLTIVSTALPALAQLPLNPTYPPKVEERINRIVHNLRAKTITTKYESGKSLQERLMHHKLPGVSIAVINDGKIEWARGFGFGDSAATSAVDVHTLFQAASLSKSITAMTVMRLKEQGTVNLDRDVNDYLTSWKLPVRGDWQPTVTLRQLLSHSAGVTVGGFDGYEKDKPIPTSLQILTGDSLVNSPTIQVDRLPGTRVRYSGGGFVIIQQLLTDRTNKPFPAIVNDELFAPLKLVNSTFEQSLPATWEQRAAVGHNRKGHPIKGGYHLYPEMAPAGLWTTPTDLGILLVEVQKALRGKSTLLRQETAAEMVHPLPLAVSRSTAFGFFLAGSQVSPRFRHEGWNEGFVCRFEVYQQEGKGAVIMTNSDAGHGLIDELMQGERSRL